MKRVKVPQVYSTYLVRAMWASTALHLKVDAKNEFEAKEQAWKKVSKMFGGDVCLVVKVKGVIE